MMLNQKGTYLAKPVKTTVEQKDSGAVQFAGMFTCTQVRTANGFEPVEGDQRIAAFLNIVQKNGELNEINVRSLKDGLGWDGRSFATLQRDDWNGTECQIVVDEREYEGQKRLEVKYLNPKDYTPGGNLATADPQTIQSLDTKYGALLRAMNGGARNAAKPTATPTAAPSSPSGSIGKDLAWGAFTHRVNEYGAEHPEDAYTEESRVEVFKKIVTELARGWAKDPKALTPADWVKVKEEIEQNFGPSTRSLIPF